MPAANKKALPAAEATKGPASYFPAIEKKHGQPIAHWMVVLQSLGPLKLMALVAHFLAGE